MSNDVTSAGDTQDGPRSAEHEHQEERAHLLPEEQAAGSVDPEAQAAAILAESEERTNDPEGTRDDSPQSPERD